METLFPNSGVLIGPLTKSAMSKHVSLREQLTALVTVKDGSQFSAFANTVESIETTLGRDTAGVFQELLTVNGDALDADQVSVLVSALYHLDSPVARRALSGLFASDSRTVRVTVMTLTSMPRMKKLRPAPVLSLERSLRIGTRVEQARAATLLGYVSSQRDEAIAILTKLLDSTKPDGLRGIALQSLAVLKAPDVMDRAVAALESKEAELVQSAADILSRVPAPEHQDALLSAMHRWTGNLTNINILNAIAAGAAPQALFPLLAYHREYPTELPQALAAAVEKVCLNHVERASPEERAALADLWASENGPLEQFQFLPVKMKEVLATLAESIGPTTGLAGAYSFLEQEVLPRYAEKRRATLTGESSKPVRRNPAL